MQHPQFRGLSEWRPLAHGAFAMVWQARQRLPDRLVAVKVYQRPLSDDDRRRFVHEMAVVNRLAGHPGIVAPYDAGTLQDGRPYLIMEFCHGGCLNQWLTPTNRPGPEHVRQVGLLVADALAAAHAHGVLHRNLKPSNILIDSGGRVRVSDFGLSALVGDGSTAAQNRTPGYTPPEMLRDQPPSESGNVFSLAATLYALLTGNPPPRAGLTAGRLECTGEVTDGGSAPVPRADRVLMSALVAALHNDPTARPTAAEFRDQLARVGPPGQAAVRLAPITAAEQQGPVRTPLDSGIKRPEGSRWTVVVLMAVLLTLMGSAIAAWLIDRPTLSGVPAAPPQSSSAPSGLPSSGPSGNFGATAPTPTVTPETREPRSSSPAAEPTISLEPPAGVAKPFEPVRISGNYSGRSGKLLQVQQREGNRWLSFPMTARTDRHGHFNILVEFGKPGRYRLRVLDPDTGVESESFVLLIGA